jgi:hypothetical protein
VLPKGRVSVKNLYVPDDGHSRPKHVVTMHDVQHIYTTPCPRNNNKNCLTHNMTFLLKSNVTVYQHCQCTVSFLGEDHSTRVWECTYINSHHIVYLYVVNLTMTSVAQTIQCQMTGEWIINWKGCGRSKHLPRGTEYNLSQYRWYPGQDHDLLHTSQKYYCSVTVHSVLRY